MPIPKELKFPGGGGGGGREGEGVPDPLPPPPPLDLPLNNEAYIQVFSRIHKIGSLVKGFIFPTIICMYFHLNLSTILQRQDVVLKNFHI